MRDFYKMKFTCIFLITATFCNVLYGQNENNTVSLVDASVDPAGYIAEMNLPPASIEGTVYLDEEWRYGNISLIGNKSLNGLMLRFDIQHNNLEFIYQGDDAKVCPLYLLSGYEIRVKSQKFYFKNVANTNLNTLKLRGVAEVLYEGDIQLYAYTSIDVQDPTYKVEFNMGRQSSRIIKKRKYYLDDGLRVYKLSGSLKKNKEVFKENFDEIDAYAKKNKLNAKNEIDLIQIIRYYENLF